LPADDQAALRGIAHVLWTSVNWRYVPAERTACTGITARQSAPRLDTMPLVPGLGEGRISGPKALP
jgi:transposase